jgi:hypothetical protein
MRTPRPPLFQTGFLDWHDWPLAISQVVIEDRAAILIFSNSRLFFFLRFLNNPPRMVGVPNGKEAPCSSEDRRN